MLSTGNSSTSAVRHGVVAQCDVVSETDPFLHHNLLHAVAPQDKRRKRQTIPEMETEQNASDTHSDKEDTVWYCQRSMVEKWCRPNLNPTLTGDGTAPYGKSARVQTPTRLESKKFTFKLAT